MAVKRRNELKQKRLESFKNSTKIKCCFCSIKGKCQKREAKEKDERMGIITYCALTPNKNNKNKEVNKNGLRNRYFRQ